MLSWERLLDRALNALGLASQAIPYTFGGGTALMIQSGHRRSKDIDLFVPDPQYLGLLHPDLSDAWPDVPRSYDQAANFLKLHYDEGEIDFIVSGQLTGTPYREYDHYGRGVKMESPAEIAIKKMHYRALHLKPRDIFDIGVVMSVSPDELDQSLHLVDLKKSDLLRRFATLDRSYYAEALDLLEIEPSWDHFRPLAWDMVFDLINRIPILDPELLQAGQAALIDFGRSGRRTELDRVVDRLEHAGQIAHFRSYLDSSTERAFNNLLALRQAGTPRAQPVRRPRP